MRLTKAFSMYCAVGLTALALVGCGQSSDSQQSADSSNGSSEGSQTWQFGLEEIEGSVQHQYAVEFKNRIEQKSDGNITVELLPYGKWGSSYSALYDAIQSGSIQLGFGSGALGGTVPESQLMSLNFVMPDDQLTTAEVLNSDGFLKSDAWQQSFRQRGLVPLAELPEGYQVWTANKEIRSPQDMRNLQIRVMDNSLLRSTYRAYGASPITIAYGELYSALQQGQADANIQPVFAHEEMGFYEVQDYMIFANQAQFVATLIGNSDWWDGLSDDQKSMVNETVQELIQVGHDVQTQFNEERLNTIRNNGDIEIIELSDQQRDAFRQAAEPVRQTYVDSVGERGQAALDTLLSEVENASSGSGGASGSGSGAGSSDSGNASGSGSDSGSMNGGGNENAGSSQTEETAS